MKSKQCPGGYSIPADKNCRGSKEAFQGASAKLKAGLSRDVSAARVAGSAVRQAISFRRTPEGRAALKSASKVYNRIPEARRKEAERRATDLLKQGVSQEAKARASEIREVAATGSSYAAQKAKGIGQKMVNRARKAFGRTAA